MLSSKKDRLGILLLLFGVIFYWFVSRQDFTKNTLWGFSEIPLSQKTQQAESQITNNGPSSEWSDRRGTQHSTGLKNTWPAKNFRADSTHFRKKDFQNRFVAISRKPPLAIALNESDSISWEQLPGIGPVLAARIIRYRDKLGGFHSVTQLKEVYGITDSVYEKINPLIKNGAEQVHTLDLNKVSLEELKMHPYLRWKIANAIIRYREANGPFQSLEDLKKIWSLSPETILKIEPYLRVDMDSVFVR